MLISTINQLTEDIQQNYSFSSQEPAVALSRRRPGARETGGSLIGHILIKLF